MRVSTRRRNEPDSWEVIHSREAHPVHKCGNHTNKKTRVKQYWRGNDERLPYVKGAFSAVQDAILCDILGFVCLLF